MEKSEPTLVPQWLKNSGNGSGGGGNATHQVASSSLHSDDHSISKSARNKSSVSIKDHDMGRLFASDRPTSSYLRRSSSSNGSAHLRSYSSSGRGHRDKDWEKDIFNNRDKDRSFLGDHRHRDYSDPLEDILPSRFEKDLLRRSQSMITGKRNEMGPRKVLPDLNHTNKSNHSIVNGAVYGGGSVVSSVEKTAFDRNFPTLGVEERHGAPEVGRVPSPGLSTAMQGSLLGTSAVIGGPGRSSALAEVPVIIGNNSTSASSVQQPVPASPASAPSTVSLNMAETLAQGPARARTAPQSPVGTQRLEELAIIQSRRLIPVTPSMPKPLVAGSSEKSKAKIVQQQYQISSSQVANHTLHGAPLRSDVPRTSSLGKLHVLKPARERNGEKNGVSPTAKDSSSPTSGKAGNNTFVVQSSAAGSASLKSPSNNSDLASDERKPVTALLTVERRPTSQAQSRNDFFNSMRKKSSTNTPALPDPLTAMSTASDNSDELIPEVAFAPVAPHVGDTSTLVTSVEECSANSRGDLACNEDTCDGSLGGDKNSINDAIFYPDEEEAAFLRSLGWEEHTGEDEGLTEEEISAFYKEYMKVGSSSKILQGTQLKIPVSINSNSGSSGGASS